MLDNAKIEYILKQIQLKCIALKLKRIKTKAKL